ncbi:DUF2605 domain-containing protein [Myxacorys almedinensis]|uniref:DUF2605 family protein n=1 Tax=Myxacorys almedinensis A TaxID=2690445 RepID=A0A8J7Z3Y1_9CYAN|nr:DUF2605 domain-containing protein [Myxacorys almedinensis]NDJ19299.1 DUF2605 family protein [Myxacorys almedinensis A]
MFDSNFPDSNLLKTVLEPLLEDFQYWFARSRTLLESDAIAFLTEAQQTDLLQRVTHAYQEVLTAQLLLKATNGQAGVDTSLLMAWHQLVSDCWQVSMRLRAEKSR